MENTAGTLVINDVSHPYIFPVVLLIFFGTIVLYNVYGLIYHHVRMGWLSTAEGLILKGHKKLVANHEDLFVEGIGVLDENFMTNQIYGNTEAIREGNAAEYKKKQEKARIREQKRKDKQNLRIAKAERKRIAKARKKISPEQKLKIAQRDTKRYNTCYKIMMIDAKMRMNKLSANLSSVSAEDQKYIDFLISKYGSKIEKKELADRRQAAAIAAKKAEKKRQRKQIQMARENADAELFSAK